MTGSDKERAGRRILVQRLPIGGGRFGGTDSRVGGAGIAALLDSRPAHGATVQSLDNHVE